MAFKGSLEDRLAIRERMDAYADGVYRKDPDAWGACWAEDAVWDLGRATKEGRAAIVEFWTGIMKGYDRVQHQVAPGSIIVNGDTAEATTHVEELLLAADGSVRKACGMYNDTLVKVGGEWLFKVRRYNPIMELPT